MISFDTDYFFITGDEENGNLPFLTPDTNTGERRYAEQPPPVGSAPLIFSNGFKDEFFERKIKDIPADILFESANFIVRDHIRERLLPLDIPGLYLHPAVYIDDREVWHEDYWFVGTTKEFDCWDREKSAFRKKKIVIGDEVLHSMISYSLNSKLLDETPLQNRLFFKMGGTTDGLVTCHKSIAGIFCGSGKTGAVIKPMARAKASDLGTRFRQHDQCVGRLIK